jgi:hypothetical protein
MRLPFTLAFLTLGTMGAAAGPVGLWRVADGTAQVHVMPCHGALCGSVRGKQVLINMKPNGAKRLGRHHRRRSRRHAICRQNLDGRRIAARRRLRDGRRAVRWADLDARALRLASKRAPPTRRRQVDLNR